MKVTARLSSLRQCQIEKHLLDKFSGLEYLFVLNGTLDLITWGWV